MQTVVYDPTAADAASGVRGVGRYLQLLRENLGEYASFSSVIRDIPFTSTFVNPFFNVTRPPLITKRIAKKQIAIIHDLIPLDYPKDFPLGIRGNLNVFNNKRALKNYDIIVTDSEASKKTIERLLKIRSEKINVIYPCLSKSFMETPPLATGYELPATSYFIYVGDATANKNLVALAKAVKQIDTQVIFVGKIFTQPKSNNAWNRELNEFMTYAEGDERFVFPGFVSDDELKQLYSHAFTNILISRDEGFGFSFLEAANCKIPSLLSDIPVFKETADDSALYARQDNIEEIVSLLKLLAGEKKLRTELADKAYKRSKFFSAEKFKKEWETVLEL